MSLNIAKNFKKLATTSAIVAASISAVVPFSSAVANDQTSSSYDILNSPIAKARDFARDKKIKAGIAIEIGQLDDLTPEAWVAGVQEALAKMDKEIGIPNRYQTDGIIAAKDADYNVTLISVYVGPHTIGKYWINSKESYDKFLSDLKGSVDGTISLMLHESKRAEKTSSRNGIEVASLQ